MPFNFVAAVTVLSDLGAHISIFCTCMDDTHVAHTVHLSFQISGSVCVCVCVYVCVEKDTGLGHTVILLLIFVGIPTLFPQ